MYSNFSDVDEERDTKMFMRTNKWMSALHNPKTFLLSQKMVQTNQGVIEVYNNLYIYMKRGFDTIVFIYAKNLTVPAGNRIQGLRIYVMVLWPLSYWDTASQNFWLS